MDFLLGCQDPRLSGICCTVFAGESGGRRGEIGVGSGFCTGEAADLGDGDRDRLQLLIAVIARDGVEAFLKPLRIGLTFGRLSEWAPFGAL